MSMSANAEDELACPWELGLPVEAKTNRHRKPGRVRDVSNECATEQTAAPPPDSLME